MSTQDLALPCLTEAELAVLPHIHAGRSNPEIASILYLSPETVKSHVGSILRKLEVQNRVQAAVQIERLRLLEDRE